MLSTLLPITKMGPEVKQWMAVGLIVLFFSVTVVYILLNAPKSESRRAHMLVTPVAFLVWSYTISANLMGTYFVPEIAFGGQALLLALCVFVRPVEYQ